MFSLHVVRALRLQALEEAAAPAADRGPARADGAGRERRRGRRRRRPRGGVQGRVAQPPERGRAVPGRGHRRRRDPARHLRASARGRSPCSTRCASASSTRARSRYLLERAVAGIGHYGNSIGVPTVGGEVYFEAPYEQNCLVNAMCVGLAPHERLIRSAAAGPGQRARAARRAHRAATGSAARPCSPAPSWTRPTQTKRPSVQIGDPFEEKKLLECCLELLERGLLRLAPGPRRRGPHLVLVGDGVQGRAWGSTSTSPACRCARRGWSRSRSWSRSPRSGCCAWSSRRGSTRCSALCERWEVRATAIGEVTDTRRLRVLRRRRGRRRHAGARRSWTTARSTTSSPSSLPRRSTRPAGALGRRGRPAEVLLALLGSPNIASQRSSSSSTTGSSARARCAVREQADAAVLRCPMAAAARSRSRSTATGAGWPAIPYRGAIEAVLECARNLACVGAEPLGLTNCLNFGNPEKPHIAWQLDAGGRGACATPASRSACRWWAATSRSTTRAAAGPIYPTPVVGMVGKLPDAARAPPLGLRRRG